MSDFDREVLAAVVACSPDHFSEQAISRRCGNAFAKTVCSLHALNDAGQLPPHAAAKLRSRPGSASTQATSTTQRAGNTTTTLRSVGPTKLTASPSVDCLATASSAAPSDADAASPESVDLARDVLCPAVAAASPAPAGGGQSLPATVMLDVDQVTVDPDMQVRAGTRLKVVEHYAELMSGGTTFPPIEVFLIADRYVLIDGFHRLEAARRNGVKEIAAVVRDGDARSGYLRAVELNHRHGEPLTREERRDVAMRMLADPTWKQWTGSTIAAACGLSEMTISRYRSEIESRSDDSTNVRVHERLFEDAAGRRRKVNTTRLGRRPHPGDSRAAPSAAESPIDVPSRLSSTTLLDEWVLASEHLLQFSAETIRVDAGPERSDRFVDLAGRVHTLSRDVQAE